MFLFDVRARLFVATDDAPVDAATHAWCCDYLKLLTSFGRLYTFVFPYSHCLSLKYLRPNIFPQLNIGHPEQATHPRSFSFSALATSYIKHSHLPKPHTSAPHLHPSAPNTLNACFPLLSLPSIVAQRVRRARAILPERGRKMRKFHDCVSPGDAALGARGEPADGAVGREEGAGRV